MIFEPFRDQEQRRRIQRYRFDRWRRTPPCTPRGCRENILSPAPFASPSSSEARNRYTLLVDGRHKLEQTKNGYGQPPRLRRSLPMVRTSPQTKASTNVGAKCGNDKGVPRLDEGHPDGRLHLGVQLYTHFFHFASPAFDPRLATKMRLKMWKISQA